MQLGTPGISIHQTNLPEFHLEELATLDLGSRPIPIDFPKIAETFLMSMELDKPKLEEDGELFCINEILLLKSWPSDCMLQTV